MKYTEFLEWLALARCEPIGMQRGDYQAALQAHVMTNAWSKRRVKFGDVLPDFYKRLPAQDTVTARILAWAHGYNKQIGAQ